MSHPSYTRIDAGTLRAPTGWRAGLVVSGARIFVTGASTVIMGVMPLLVGLFAARLQLNWQQIGWLGTAGQAGTFSGALAAYWLIGRRKLRLGVELGAACALAFALLTAAADSYLALLWCRALTSVGVGCAFATGTWLLGRSGVPARNFSIMSGVQVACGSIHAALLPWIYTHAGYGVAIASVAFWFAVILLVALSVPALASTEGPVEVAKTVPAARRTAVPLAAILLLGSIIGFQSSVVVTWIYSERVATAAGLATGEIGTAIALGSLGGVVAGGLGGWVGDRFGYFPLLSLATAAVMGGDWLMFEATSFTFYLGAQFVFNFGWMLGLSYYMGLLARRDEAGRVMRLAPPSLVIAGALGPFCVAAFTSGNSATAVLALSLALSATALVLAVLHRR